MIRTTKLKKPQVPDPGELVAFDDLQGRPKYGGVEMTSSTDIPTYESIHAEIVGEAGARRNSDIDLQRQIDAIVVSSDVKDVVGTKAELDEYDTSSLGDNDIIKVLSDETQDDATTYYRWSTTTEAFTLIGSEGPYYTKSESDTLLDGKQNTLTFDSIPTDESLNPVTSDGIKSYVDTVAALKYDASWIVETEIATQAQFDELTNAIENNYVIVVESGNEHFVVTGAIVSDGDPQLILSVDTVQYYGATPMISTISFFITIDHTTKEVSLEVGYLDGPDIYQELSKRAKTYDASWLLTDGQTATNAHYNELKAAITDRAYIYIIFPDGAIVTVVRTAIDSSNNLLINGQISYITTQGANKYVGLTAAEITVNGSTKVINIDQTSFSEESYADRIKELEKVAKRGAGAPTTSTAGEIGQIYEDTVNGKLYICTSISASPVSFTWIEVGSGGGGGNAIVNLTPTNITTAQVDVTADKTVAEIKALSDAGNEVLFKLEVPVAISGYPAGTYYFQPVLIDSSNVMASAGSPTGGEFLYAQLPGTSGTIYNLETRDNLTSSDQMATVAPLSAYQGKVLNDKVEGRVKVNAGAPTTATVGTVGQILEDTTNGKLYICTAVASNPASYTWVEVATGGATDVINSTDWSNLWQ